jgi:hypothetical protein
MEVMKWQEVMKWVSCTALPVLGREILNYNIYNCYNRFLFLPHRKNFFPSPGGERGLGSGHVTAREATHEAAPLTDLQS